MNANNRGRSDAPPTSAEIEAALSQRRSYGPITQEEIDSFIAMCQQHGLPNMSPEFDAVRRRYYKLSKEQRRRARGQTDEWLGTMPTGMIANVRFTMCQLLEEALTLIESGHWQ